MDSVKCITWKTKLEHVTPSFVRRIAKKIFWKVIRLYNRVLYINKGRFVEFGYRFRFSRIKPYYAKIGERTITEDFNVWNAKSGNIIVGKKCWFGLNNIVMGPVEISDEVSTGLYVCILGPRHPILGHNERHREKTFIGKNVWIGTGSIIQFGINIGDNAIISAGSVVTKDVEPAAFIAGNPARNLSNIASSVWQKTIKK